MKGFAMLKIRQVGWIEKQMFACGSLDAIVRPLAVSPCTSDIDTVYKGAIGDLHNMILGHKAVGQVVEVGALVRDFKRGDRVTVPVITSDWISVEVPVSYFMRCEGILEGWKFSDFKGGVFGEYFHVNEADDNLIILPDSPDPADVVMLSNMVSRGFHGVEIADMQFGDSVCPASAQWA